ncbi:MAG: SGNH/GDSL hydrolase family protein, partial [Myxococcota bacterium]|nr:SGNH/GDSL hydrolase family protein [Myxococcota bacterium]
GKPARVLLLGGSVLARGDQDIHSVLQKRLRQKLGRPVQLVNVASPAHTTLDSLRKYRLLADQPFDLVVFYHGINDVRANLCPDDVFRPDYTHMLWHRQIQRLEAHPELSFLAHPYVLHLLVATVIEQLWPPRLLPMRNPDGVVDPGGEYVSSWVGYGATIKTRPTFQRNVEAVIRLARQKGEPLLLMTFATYQAPGYSFARFKARNLDYARHWVPTEVWGAPAHVPVTVAAHNEVIRASARQHRGVHFVDMATSIPHGRDHFDDICHLAPAGEKAWVEAMLGKAVGALKQGRTSD